MLTMTGKGGITMRFKTVRILFGISLGLVASVALAQAPVPDTLLHLKSGDEIRGTLVEVKDGAYVLKLPDGRTVLYPTSDVDSAERISAERKSSGAKGVALLAPGRRVYVRPVPEKDIHEVVANLLREWGRWPVVDKSEDADIVVRLVLSGSAGLGLAGIVATIEDASVGTEIWKSNKQTGTRNMFHGYPRRTTARLKASSIR
jgi:hypothetical protein